MAAFSEQLVTPDKYVQKNQQMSSYTALPMEMHVFQQINVIYVSICTFLYALPVGDHPLLVLQILQLQMPRQTGHIQLGFILASSTFSPYLH
jgi:hypothetical protein